MKTCVFLLLCLVGVRLGRGESWFLTIAAGAGAAIFAISLLPYASWLKLDEQGFTINQPLLATQHTSYGSHSR